MSIKNKAVFVILESCEDIRYGMHEYMDAWVHGSLRSCNHASMQSCCHAKFVLSIKTCICIIRLIYGMIIHDQTMDFSEIPTG